MFHSASSYSEPIIEEVATSREKAALEISAAKQKAAEEGLDLMEM